MTPSQSARRSHGTDRDGPRALMGLSRWLRTVELAPSPGNVVDNSTLWSYVGMLLNLERDSRGIAATDLAACTGIDLPLVQRGLNGEPVDITVVRTLALALGWRWSDLLRRLAELPVATSAA